MMKPILKKLQFETTTKCNATCVFCGRQGTFKTNPDYMSKPDLDPEIFNIIDLSKIEFISFCGIVGDVSLYKHLEKAIENIRKQNEKCVIELFTNGFAHNNDWWYSIGKQLTYNKYNRSIFCLDGLEESHYKYRGTDFNTVLQHMESYAKSGSWTQVQCLAFKHNQHEINQLRELVKSKGATVFFTRFSRYYEGDFEPPISSPYEDSLYRWNTSLNKTRRPTCMLLNSNIMFIDVEGYAYPCCHYAGEIVCRYPYSADMIRRLKAFLKDKDERNLFKVSLDEVLESKFFQNILENHQKLTFCQNKCNSTRNDYILVLDEQYPDNQKKVCRGC